MKNDFYLFITVYGSKIPEQRKIMAHKKLMTIIIQINTDSFNKNQL